MMNTSLVRAGLAQSKTIRLAVCGHCGPYVLASTRQRCPAASTITYVQGNNSDRQASEHVGEGHIYSRTGRRDLNVIAVGWNDSNSHGQPVTIRPATYHGEQSTRSSPVSSHNPSIYAKNTRRDGGSEQRHGDVFFPAAAFRFGSSVQRRRSTNPVDGDGSGSGNSAPSSSGAVTTTKRDRSAFLAPTWFNLDHWSGHRLHEAAC